WQAGDLEAGFKQADLVLDETFVGNNTSHQPLETRTAMAYWQNGKLYMHCSTQSTMRTVSAVARWVGIDRANVVIISDYTAGGSASWACRRMAMGWGTPTMLTSTRTRGGQCAPGGLQCNSIMAPVMAKAARRLGIDAVAIHRISAPEGQAPFRAPITRGRQT